MAATGLITIVTVIDQLKLDLNQVGGDLLTDAQYTDIVTRHTNSASTWTLSQVYTGSYSIQQGSDELLAVAFVAASGGPPNTVPFTAQATADYRLNGIGPTLTITEGVDTRTQIPVTGNLVSYNAAKIDILEIIKTRLSQRTGIDIGGGDADYDTTWSRVRQMIQELKGAQAL